MHTGRVSWLEQPERTTNLRGDAARHLRWRVAATASRAQLWRIPVPPCRLAAEALAAPARASMSIQTSKNVAVFAPHPDDETLGCGGTLLALRARGVAIHWVIATDMDPTIYSSERVTRREREITACAAALNASVIRLGFTSARLDEVPTSSLVRAVAEVISSVRPDTVLAPFRGDAHSDHAALADAVLAASKPMRAPSVRRVWAYEVPSETEIGWREEAGFRPNAFVDISTVLAEKLELLDVWGEEIGVFPQPRSRDAVEAWARVRGATVGFNAAEAFMVLRERVTFEAP